MGYCRSRQAGRIACITCRPRRLAPAEACKAPSLLNERPVPLGSIFASFSGTSAALSDSWKGLIVRIIEVVCACNHCCPGRHHRLSVLVSANRVPDLNLHKSRQTLPGVFFFFFIKAYSSPTSSAIFWLDGELTRAGEGQLQVSCVLECVLLEGFPPLWQPGPNLATDYIQEAYSRSLAICAPHLDDGSRTLDVAPAPFLSTVS